MIWDSEQLIISGSDGHRLRTVIFLLLFDFSAWLKNDPLLRVALLALKWWVLILQWPLLLVLVSTFHEKFTESSWNPRQHDLASWVSHEVIRSRWLCRGGGPLIVLKWRWWRFPRLYLLEGVLRERWLGIHHSWSLMTLHELNFFTAASIVTSE